MVYKYLIAIAIITIAMLLAFLPAHVKQTTAITSVKGFTTYGNAGYYDNLVLINASTQATGSYPLSLPSQYNTVIGFFVEGFTNPYPPANLLYTNSQTGVNDTLPYVCSNSGDDISQTCLYNFTDVKNNLYPNKAYMDITSGNYASVDTGLIGLAGSFENISQAPSFQYSNGKWYSFEGSKGQKLVFISDTSASFPGAFTSCYNTEYSSYDSSLNEQANLYLYVCNITANANINITTNAKFPLLDIFVQKPQTLTFSSTFSYISPNGIANACYYNNPYKPLVYVNGTLASVTENSFKLINPSGVLARYDSVYGFGGHNYRNASGPSYQILPNGQLNKPDLWITVPNSVSYIDTALDDEMYTGGGSPIFSTLLFNPAQLSQATLFYVNQSSIITKVGQIETAVDYLTDAVQGASYTQVYANGSIEQLGKPVFSFTALLSNSTRLLYSNITLDIRIPTNFSTDNISQIRDPNLTISYGDIVPNSDYYFYMMPAAYYKEIAAHAANDTYILGSNSTHSGIVYTIPLNKSQIQLVKDTNGFINLHVPAVLVFNLNNTNPAGGYYNNVNKTFTAAYYAATYKMSYEIAAPQYTVSLLNAGSKINVTYDSGNTTIMSVYNSKENMSYLDTLSGNNYNSNILLWSYNLEDITYNLEFTSLLNSKLWTSNSIVNYAGKNYTIGSNGYINIPVPAGSTINFIDYVFYNTGYKKVQYTNFVTVPYNPCDPITNYAYSLSNTANINGTIIGTVTGTGQNKTGTGSSGPSVTPPSNITSLSYWEYQLKQWGLLFGSIIVMGLIAFKFGVDKKGVQNPQVMAIAAIIFVALNLFGLAEGLGNIYITGILVFLAAIIMFEMLLKIFHRGGN